MKILIIAPHQDDEILATGGLIQKSVALGDQVTILFVTNGDYHGPRIAKQRYYESKNALLSLGVAEKNIFYLGYADTGMRFSHSFLRKLASSDANQALTAPFSSMTYHPAKKSTIHSIRTGIESLLTPEAFLSDLEWFIEKNMPDLIIVPDSADMHGDHAAILTFLKKMDIFHQIPICMTYMIHGGDDMLWPPREIKEFTCPPALSYDVWEKRISIPLTEQEYHKKNKAIASFRTQLKDDLSNFLSSFSKQEEPFFLLRNNEFSRQNIYNHFVYTEIS